MAKHLFIPTSHSGGPLTMSYESTTHKLNLTGNEISTVLYLVDDYIEGNEYRLSDPDFKSYVDRIYAELQSVTDNYFAQLEARDDNNYAECVDHLVNTMEGQTNDN